MSLLHKYEIDKLYSKSVAYFSMEFAIHQALKIYSGGLGFLAGSHMRSAYDLKQNLIGVGMLWSYGYYDQGRDEDRYLKIEFRRKRYYFLEDLNITVSVDINGKKVFVRAYLVPSELFNCAPLILLSTDIPENDYLSRTITHKLYDSNSETRVAQEIVLGVGGTRVLEELGINPEIYHMNEGHSLPMAFELYQKFKDINEVKKRVVFTTHTPEKAGNEEHKITFLSKMGFFGQTPLEEVRKITGIKKEKFSLTVGALKMSKIANGVSKIHGDVANDMWKEVENRCKIISITNAQNRRYWVDKSLLRALDEHEDFELAARKKHLKRMLFDEVANQTGKMFDPEILTIVWARRFAEYKRPGLLKYDLQRFENLINNQKYPIQIIWAGKPYPFDSQAINIFNEITHMARSHKNIAVLVGYELDLSMKLKKGADIWLNTPRVTREASGTSGMSAAMNGAINLSIADGWHPEFCREGVNSFTIPTEGRGLSIEEQDRLDNKNLMDILENKIIPLYYDNKKEWLDIKKNSISDVIPAFDSGRMVHEYYTLMYNA
ncbi:alpha-glucan family phosphorylase [Halarcobacter anaerophilus]|uniref:Alpha-glucan family phosphorylase n=1 Tax=Halarcobacter anaerophilus TaxID=877500 RepID=A0A4Q0XYD4_9BACT|nr:alpha-glucan family phosphorylase [Halarcobacter anaerophilus]QDF30162.1 alpha-glucan phosphorylase [Halarcobacter anaerophilus]RXJ62273.1 alpha-glucan family phosphorylase [Halarcobacter anaerophilus]